MSRDDLYYAAMKARDPRFDGKFFVGVKTTGIYCRPICPAQPKRQNVTFFSHALAAEKAGYRPCLRCRPESAPLSATWMGTSAVVKRALRTLHTTNALQQNEDQFAAGFGVTARHLRRLFVEELGKTPRQLVLENRLALARQFVVETRMPVTQVAYAAGFQSIRRFNDAFLRRFHRSPSHLRKHRKDLSASREVEIFLPYRPPFDFQTLLAFYRSHQVGDLERFTEHEMHRIVEKDGKIGQVSLSDDPKNHRIRVRLDLPDSSLFFETITRVKALLDLDSDPLVIENALGAAPALRRLWKKTPGIRIPSGWDAYEVGVATLLGQCVSIARGRTLVRDLIQLLGREATTPWGTQIKLFPTPAQVAAADLSSLGTTGIRKRALQAFSQAIASGDLHLGTTQDEQSFRAGLLRIPGIGRWSADYMLLKVLRHTDAFPETDLILARTLHAVAPAEIERTRPWRAYAAILLWRHSNALVPPAPKKGKKK